MDQALLPYARDRYAALIAAVEAAEDGLCVTNRQGGLLYQNGALRRLITTEPERRALEAAIADARNAALARGDQDQLGARSAVAASSESRHGSSVTMTAGDSRRPSVTLHVRTSTSEYRVRCATVGASDRGWEETTIVAWVRRCRPRHLTLETLRERYGLTPREVRVASLVAARSGSREIAEALGISAHTARRHAEAVLRKLGVHSRADVRERLRE
jgi:DNA-binding CsgD family transcriptional regulator